MPPPSKQLADSTEYHNCKSQNMKADASEHTEPTERAHWPFSRSVRSQAPPAMLNATLRLHAQQPKTAHTFFFTASLTRQKRQKGCSFSDRNKTLMPRRGEL